MPATTTGELSAAAGAWRDIEYCFRVLRHFKGKHIQQDAKHRPVTVLSASSPSSGVSSDTTDLGSMNGSVPIPRSSAASRVGTKRLWQNSNSRRNGKRDPIDNLNDEASGSSDPG
jgi:hypothetical protein